MEDCPENREHVEHAYPRCPSCGGDVLGHATGMKSTMIPGTTFLFYCTDEMGCGWIETVNDPVDKCVKYYINTAIRKLVFDVSGI